MPPFHFVILTLLLFLQLVAPSARVLSESPPQLDNLLAKLNCEGWLDNTSNSPSLASNQNTTNLNIWLVPEDLLKEYHCQDKSLRVLQRGQRKIFLEAYQFGTTDGAFGAYSAMHHGSSSYQSLGDASSEDQNSLSFWKNKYFVYLHSSELDDDEAKAAINKLAIQLIANDQLIEQIKNDNEKQSWNSQRFAYTGKPVIFNYMPNLDRVRASEKLVMGPIGLKRFFPAPYSTALTPLLEGAIADYKIEEPHRDRLKLLVAYYPTPQQASITFAKYVSILGNQNDEKSAEGYTHTTAIFKVAENYVLCQLRDKRIMVIRGARHKDSLGELIRQVSY